MTPISIKNIYQILSKPNSLLNSIHIILLLYKKNTLYPFVLRMCVPPPKKLIPLCWFLDFIPRQPFPALNGPFPSQPLLLRTPTTPSPLTKFPSTNYHSHYTTSVTTKYHHLLITSIYQSLLYIYSPYLLTI